MIARLVMLLCALFFVQVVRWWLIGTKLGNTLLTAAELTLLARFQLAPGIDFGATLHSSSSASWPVV